VEVPADLSPFSEGELARLLMALAASVEDKRSRLEIVANATSLKAERPAREAIARQVREAGEASRVAGILTKEAQAEARRGAEEAAQNQKRPGRGRRGSRGRVAYTEVDESGESEGEEGGTGGGGASGSDSGGEAAFGP